MNEPKSVWRVTDEIILFIGGYVVGGLTVGTIVLVLKVARWFPF